MATVSVWNEEEGWGVIDSPETPGGCWASFSHIAGHGYRSLRAGQVVLLQWETADQDGYAFRAVIVRPHEDSLEPAHGESTGHTGQGVPGRRSPQDPQPACGCPGGIFYTTMLSLFFDEPDPPS
jgi:CspA family cold shock protein